jgi:hypothetical protein
MQGTDLGSVRGWQSLSIDRSSYVLLVDFTLENRVVSNPITGRRLRNQLLGMCCSFQEPDW